MTDEPNEWVGNDDAQGLHGVLGQAGGGEAAKVGALQRGETEGRTTKGRLNTRWRQRGEDGRLT